MDSREFQKKYHVIAKLGEGGMALVHLAVSQGVAGVRKLVVLKSVRPELLADPSVSEMFLAEARLASTLNHHNIVQTFEVVVHGGAPVLVMEYLEGQPLSRILRRAERRGDAPAGRGPPLPLRLFAIRELLNGLAYVHDVTNLDGTPLNLVHRDISPHNVFLTYDGHVKILDFGIAKAIGNAGHTQIGQMKGKVRYMPPEQMLGLTRVDRRSDVYSVGVMLWEALVGRRLWEGQGDTQVMQNVLAGEVPPPRIGSREVPAALDEVCRRALAREMTERYESAGAMLAELERAMDDLRLQTTPRVVGEYVARRFADVRSATKKIIERQLRDESAAPVHILSTTESEAATARGAAISAAPWQSPTSLSMSAPQVSLPPESRRSLPSVLAMGALLAIGVVALASTGVSLQRLRARYAAHPAPLLTSIVATSLRGAGLRASPPPLAGAPASATPAPPFSALAPAPPGAAGAPETATATAPAPAPAPATAPAPAPAPAPATAPAPAPAPATAPATAPAPAPAPATAPATAPAGTRPAHRVRAPRAAATAPRKSATRACDPPFYFDAERIKRLKPECLD